MSEQDPWRDPAYYQHGPVVKCIECGIACHETHWGAWCFKCNVERIERISKQFKDLLDE